MSSFDGNDDDDDVVDIVSARPIQKQEERKHGTVPSAGIPLPSFDFLSPIGKPKMREPGPLTSTPRVAIANPRPLTTYGRGHDEDKLPNITEVCSFSLYILIWPMLALCFIEFLFKHRVVFKKSRNCTKLGVRCLILSGELWWSGLCPSGWTELVLHCVLFDSPWKAQTSVDLANNY